MKNPVHVQQPFWFRTPLCVDKQQKTRQGVTEVQDSQTV